MNFLRDLSADGFLPWGDFFDLSRCSVPRDANHLYDRATGNLKAAGTNYAIIFAAILVVLAAIQDRTFLLSFLLSLGAGFVTIGAAVNLLHKSDNQAVFFGLVVLVLMLIRTGTILQVVNILFVELFVIGSHLAIKQRPNEAQVLQKLAKNVFKMR